LLPCSSETFSSPSAICIKTYRFKYKKETLTSFLYRYEISSLTLREEHRLRVFENRVFRRIFGLKRDEVTGVEKTAQWGAS
jgi:hypothetical protein